MPAAALLFAVATWTPAPAAQPGSLQVRFSRAEGVFRSGDYETAIRLLDGVIATLESHGDAGADEIQLLLRRSLTYRAIARWSRGDRDGLNAELDRIVELDPAFVLTEDSAPEGLVDRYARRRERKVGFLRIATFPVDARVFVNGARIDPVPDLLPVLAGEYEVYADKPGFAYGEESVRVRANRTEGVGLELERSSATMRIATVPFGATVVVDGDVIGRTLGAEDETAREARQSAPLVVEGLLPGWHELEVTLRDYRPFRQRVEVPDLADYDLGLLRLDRAVGMVVLRGLPRDAHVYVDEELQELEWQSGFAVGSGSAGSGRMVLPVGDHLLSVTYGDAGVFEAGVVVEDGGTVGFDVELRPGLMLLGVAGGDELDRDAVGEMLRRHLGSAPSWFLLDRSAGDQALEQLGVPVGRRAAATPEEVAATVDWDAVRTRATASMPAGLLVLATLPAAAPPGSFDLWVWPSAPGLARPMRLRMSVDDEEPMRRFAADIESPLPAATSWLGATLLDSRLTSQPTIVMTRAGGPAAMAGLRAGDEILAVDGVEVTRVSEVVAAVEATEPFAALTIQYRRAGGVAAAGVTMGSSPRLVGRDAVRRLGPVIWAAATAEIARGGSVTPSWVMQTDQALILMAEGEWELAAGVLGRITAPEDVPFGRGAVDYWRGLALVSVPNPDTVAARAAFERAAAHSGARLYHHDGPLVAPRARAQIALLDAGGRDRD